MIEFINEEKIKLFRNKLFLFLNYTLPGVIALEIFFKKGYFTTPPDNLFQFLLFILWSFILSLPYNFFDTVSCADVIKYVKKKKLDNNEKDEIKKIDLLAQKEKDGLEHIDAKLQFLFTLIYPFITYLLYKILITYFDIRSFWNINIGLIMYVICLLGIFTIAYPVFRYISKNTLINLIQREYNI